MTNNNNNKRIDDFRPAVRSAKPKGHKRTVASMIILWVLALTVIASIGFSSYMVYFGTTDSTAKMLILPQVIFAGLMLIILPAVVLHKTLSNK